MVKREVKGIHRVAARGQVYWYAWRGGPRLHGEEGSADFWASYNGGNPASRHIPEAGDASARWWRFTGRAPTIKKLAPATKENWGPWLDRIAEYFGLSIAQFERPEKIRPIVRKWRNRYADRPRTADVALQVLSCVWWPMPSTRSACSPAIPAKASSSSTNLTVPRSSGPRPTSSASKRRARRKLPGPLISPSHTGLRVGDLLRLSWSHVGDDAIVITTAKSGHKREAIIPLYDALKRRCSPNIPKRSTTILTNRQSRPWIKDSFSSAFNDAKHKAGMADANLHFHDLRGTAATRFYIAGLSERVIAEILGWSEENVGKIIRRYVDRSAATKAIIRQLNARNEK